MGNQIHAQDYELLEIVYCDGDGNDSMLTKEGEKGSNIISSVVSDLWCMCKFIHCG